MADRGKVHQSVAWRRLQEHVEVVNKAHLRDLLQDVDRSAALRAEHNGVYLDYSRQRVTTDTMDLLFGLAEEVDLKGKLNAMVTGQKINTTEDRAVLHVALRASPDQNISVDGQNVVPAVHSVLDRIRDFSERVRSGQHLGHTGQPLKDTVAIGIGGSYLGPEFVNQALRFDPTAARAAQGRRLRFLANVDPVDVSRNLEDFDPATTLVIIISKTFTTAETMLNARTVRRWLTTKLGDDAVSKHMVAVSTNTSEVSRFGIDTNNVFEFWDWVGGRYSVCSAVGILPLAVQYGSENTTKFLAGARSVDQHLVTTNLRQNIPVLLGLLGVWNSTFLGYPTRALLPYSQALDKLAPHIQQVDMESNGKRVAIDGSVLPFQAGEVNFGEPGTNGQHSFYQLIHQGRVVPCDMIGFCESQTPIQLPNEPVSNHDELMSNFFAQPDALATGKSLEQVLAEGVPPALAPHKVFDGNRPSNVLLLPRLDAFNVGQILAVYEHRTAVQGFVWGINSFDQWGVELGKVLAKQVRSQLEETRKNNADISDDFNPSTRLLLARYLGKPSL